jgi:hypothetical protein
MPTPSDGPVRGSERGTTPRASGSPSPEGGAQLPLAPELSPPNSQWGHPDAPPPPKQAVYPSFVADADEARFRYDAAVRMAAHVLGEPPESKHTQFCAWRLYTSDIET